MWKKKSAYITLILALSSVSAGCGMGADATKGVTNPTSNEPVTIKIYKYALGFQDWEFDRYFVEEIKKKYPNITLEMVKDSKGNSPEELLTAGSFPDIILTSNTSINKLINLDLVENLSDMLKKDNFNTNRIKPVVLDSLKLYSTKGDLLGLPFSLNMAALVYNKDIFDKFGVPYPKDLMTWDEAIEIGRKLTRQQDGIDFIGIDLDNPDRVGGGSSLQLVDPNTKKASINNDAWKRSMEVLQKIYQIPNFVNGTSYMYRGDSFFKQQKLAMMSEWIDNIIGPIEDMNKKGQTMNWDIVSNPNFKENLGTGREVDIHLMMLSKTSQHKAQALQVMEHMLSDDIQTMITRSGRVSALNKPELEKQFGAELVSLKGKNIEGIFKAKPRQLHIPSEYDKDIVKPRLAQAAKDVATTGKDINTSLRDAEEAANKLISEEEAKKVAK